MISILAENSELSTAFKFMKIVAIGDIHGCALNFINLLFDPNITGDELILLGDLFDRSPYLNGDQKVLELVRIAQKDPKPWGFNKVTVLRGNHEDMLVRAIERGPESEAYELWEYNGGDSEFYEIAKENTQWLKKLPYYAIRGNYLFVHAGVRPDVPLEKQTKSDLIWIREEFLDYEHNLPYVVVHGHTPVEEITVTDRHINLDTGCFFTNNLSHMEFEYEPTMGSQDDLSRKTTNRSGDCEHSIRSEGESQATESRI